MSSIWDFIAGLFKTVSHPPTRIIVKPSNYINNSLTPAQKAAIIGAAAAAEHHYIRLWVSRMLLQDSVKWFTTLYPAVYSIVHLHFGNSDVDLSNLAGPKQLGNLKQADVNHSLSINEPMTGLLPFRGGTVELSCGLASMPISNLLANFLSTVGDFASKLAQPQVSAGIALASSIATGIQSLMGASDAKLALYYDDTFTGVPGEQTLQSGFVFLSDQPSGSISPDQLWVIDGEPKIGATAAGARPIAGQNYMLLQIELLTDRDDWDQFTAIEQPLQSAINAKIAGKTTDAANFLITARLAALDSTDLTNVDRVRVINAINDAYNSAPIGTASTTGAVVSLPLRTIMKSAMPFLAAEKETLPTRESLLRVG